MTELLVKPVNGPNQVGALPIRLHAEGFVEVMLITSRRSGRWAIPKGWLKSGVAPHEVAVEVAEAEAGLIGQVNPEQFGTFAYDKRLASGITMPCNVAVYLFRPDEQLASECEQGERKCRWLPSREAVSLICNLALQRLVRKIGRQPELLWPVIRRRSGGHGSTSSWYRSTTQSLSSGA